MSTIIRGGSITVDGLAPSGGGDNNPTVDNLKVNMDLRVGRRITADRIEMADGAGYHNSH